MPSSFPCSPVIREWLWKKAQMKKKKKKKKYRTDWTCEIFSHEDVSSHYVKSCYWLNLIVGQILKSCREFSCSSLSIIYSYYLLIIYFCLVVTHNYLRLSLSFHKYEKTNYQILLLAFDLLIYSVIAPDLCLLVDQLFRQTALWINWV